MGRVTDVERRDVARRLREIEQGVIGALIPTGELAENILRAIDYGHSGAMTPYGCLADLIEPSYEPDAEYEAWYNGLSHFGDERGGPSTIRELIEEIVWATLTVDLGPNGNTDSIGVDEGCVYTDKLFAEWEREALRLSGGCDRDALLALVDEMETADPEDLDVAIDYVTECASRMREALGVES